jgi:hypothetical protein
MYDRASSHQRMTLFFSGKWGAGVEMYDFLIKMNGNEGYNPFKWEYNYVRINIEIVFFINVPFINKK